jgi:hypothetical protein
MIEIDEQEFRNMVVMHQENEVFLDFIKKINLCKLGNIKFRILYDEQNETLFLEERGTLH